MRGRKTDRSIHGTALNNNEITISTCPVSLDTGAGRCYF